MRLLAWTLLLLSSLLLTSGREPPRRVINVSTADELQAALGKPLDNVTINLAPGKYLLRSRLAEISAGSMATRPITVGVRITGRNLRLAGPDEGSAEVVSTALFRLYFDGCEDCELEHVTVVTESPSPRDSTVGAAILATNSAVRIINCVIRDRAI